MYKPVSRHVSHKEVYGKPFYKLNENEMEYKHDTNEKTRYTMKCNRLVTVS